MAASMLCQEAMPLPFLSLPQLRGRKCSQRRLLTRLGLRLQIRTYMEWKLPIAIMNFKNERKMK